MNYTTVRADEVMVREEFWYVLVFVNCPYIPDALKERMQRLVECLNTDPLSEKKKQVDTQLAEVCGREIPEELKEALERVRELMEKPGLSDDLRKQMESIKKGIFKARINENIKKKITEKCFKALEDATKVKLSFSQQANNLIYDFLCKPEKDLFFNWDYYRCDVTKQLTFRTSRMTDFKPYKNKKSGEGMGSLDD